MSYSFILDELRGFNDLEIFYKEFIFHLHNGAHKSIIFDLSHIDFLTLEALLALLCASKYWRMFIGTKVEWRASDTVKLYLERADVVQMFANDIVVEDMPDERWRRGASLSLMEIREIADNIEQNSVDVSNTILAASHLMLGRVSTKQLGGSSTLLSEVAQNIIHSASMGYALVQIYQDNGNHRVHIGVMDTGIGIPASLSPKYPGLPKPSDYLRQALKAGITSSKAGNGLGLFQVENIVSNGRGALTIRSGTCMLQIYRNNLYQWDKLADIPGTQVYITMWGDYEPGKWNYLLPH